MRSVKTATMTIRYDDVSLLARAYGAASTRVDVFKYARRGTGVSYYTNKENKADTIVHASIRDAKSIRIL